MTKLAAGLLGMALVFAPTLLRYQHVAGRSQTVRITQQTITTLQAGSNPAVTLSVQDMTLKVYARVISAGGGKAVVEERRADGMVKTKAAAGSSEAVLPRLVRLVTYTPQGKILKVQRKSIPGVKDAGPELLEGFAVELPSKLVNPGATWSGAVSAVGLAGAPITVRYTSRYVGPATRGGHPCSQISTTLSSSFPMPAQAGATPGQAKLTGSSTSYLAGDIGADVEYSADLSLSYPAQLATGGGTVSGILTLRSRLRGVAGK